MVALVTGVQTFALPISAVPFDYLECVFLKPAASQHFNNALGKKGVWARDSEELVRVWSELHALGFVVIAQEYVPGTAADHYFIDGFRDHAGNICGAMARRRLRIFPPDFGNSRSEEHTSELQSLMRISYAVFCLKKKKNTQNMQTTTE